MSICGQCTSIKEVPTCTTNLEIGTIGSNNAAAFVFVHNLSTGLQYRQSVTSSGAGLITLLMANPRQDFYNPNSAYEVWVTLASGAPVDREDLTIGGTLFEDACLNVPFTIYVDDNNDPVTYATIALEVDA